jgi:hypothetical protein
MSVRILRRAAPYLDALSLALCLSFYTFGSLLSRTLFYVVVLSTSKSLFADATEQSSLECVIWRHH